MISRRSTYFQIIFRRLAADIYNDLRIILLQEGNIALAEHVDAGVLQTDGVQHAAGHFCDAGRWIAWPWMIGHALGDNSAQAGQIHELTVFHAGTKRSGSCHYRILQLNSSQIYFQIHSSTSFALNTGPSLQTRLLCT